MADERTPFCKDLLAGKCYRGTNCKFRHHGPERPRATPFGCEQFPAPLAIGPPGTFTLLGKNSIVTLEGGAKVRDLKLMALLQVSEIKASLEISWRKPTRTISLRYDDPKVMFGVSRAFHGINVYGLNLSSQVAPIYVPKKGLVRGVRISNVPEAVDRNKLLSLAPACPRPAHINFGKPTYRAKHGPEIVRKRIRAAADAHHIVKYDLDLPQNSAPGAMEQRVVVEVKDTSDLRAFAQQCKNMAVRDLGGLRLRAKERWSLVVQLGRQDYLRLEQRLCESMTRLRREFCVDLEVHDSATDATTKVLFRGSRQGVIDAKAVLDQVFVRGTSSQLEELQKRKLAVWRTDALLTKQQQTHRIKLTKTTTYKCALKGLEAARAAVGATKVMLDENSNPPAIVVTGPTAVLRTVQDALFPESGRYMRSEPSACAICFDESEVLVIVPRCRHKCCIDCFQQYCTVDVESRLPLRCFSPSCETSLPLQLLVKQLTRSELAMLANASTEIHLKSNPDTYAKCPGSDCSAYYIAADKPSQCMCSACCTIICTDCNAPLHSGETCQENQERISGHLQQLQEYLDSGKAKRCPNCTAVIEKEGGCNHMVCFNCHVHFCYECLAIKETGNQLYRHLIEVHGSYGDPENEALMAHIDAVYADVRAFEEPENMIPAFEEAFQEANLLPVAEFGNAEAVLEGNELDDGWNHARQAAHVGHVAPALMLDGTENDWDKPRQVADVRW